MSNLNKLKITLYLFVTIAVVNTAKITMTTATAKKLPTSTTSQKRTTATTTTKHTTTTVSTTHTTSASSVKPQGPQTYEYFMDTCSSQKKQFLYNIDDDVIVRPWFYGPNDPGQKLPPVRCSFTIARYSASELQFSFDNIDIEYCGVFILIYMYYGDNTEETDVYTCKTDKSTSTSHTRTTSSDSVEIVVINSDNSTSDDYDFIFHVKNYDDRDDIVARDVGLLVGLTLGLVLIGLLVGCVIWRKRSRQKSRDPPLLPPPSSTASTVQTASNYSSISTQSLTTGSALPSGRTSPSPPTYTQQEGAQATVGGAFVIESGDIQEKVLPLRSEPTDQYADPLSSASIRHPPAYEN